MVNQSNHVCIAEHNTTEGYPDLSIRLSVYIS